MYKRNKKLKKNLYYKKIVYLYIKEIKNFFIKILILKNICNNYVCFIFFKSLTYLKTINVQY